MAEEGLPNPDEIDDPVARISVVEFDVRRELKLSSVGETALRNLSDFVISEQTQ